MNKIKLLPLTTLIFLCALSIYNVLCFFTTYDLLNTRSSPDILSANQFALFKLFLGIIFTTINIIIYFTYVRYFFYFSGVIISLGVVNLLSFTTDLILHDIGGSIGIFSFEIRIDQSSFLLLILWLIIFIVDNKARLLIYWTKL